MYLVISFPDSKRSFPRYITSAAGLVATVIITVHASHGLGMVLQDKNQGLPSLIFTWFLTC